MTRPLTLSLALALLSLSGGACANLSPGEDLWVLPPLDIPEPAEVPPPPTTIALLGTRAVVAAPQPWTSAEPLELSHVIRSVERTYPLLSLARQEAIMAQAAQLRAFGAYDLTLDAGAQWAPLGFYENNTARAGLMQQTGLWGLKVWGGYRLGAGDFDPTFDGKRVTNHGGEFSAGAKLPLLRGGSIDKYRAELWSATLGTEVADAEIARRRLGFELEAALAYWSWLAASRQFQVVEGLVDLAEARQQGVAARVARGDLPEIEEADNSRLVVKRQTLLIKARRTLEKSAIKLSLFLRDATGNPIRPDAQAAPSAFPEPAAPRLEGLLVDLRAAIRQRPDLQGLARELEQAGVKLEFAENLLLPQLDLSVYGSQDLDGSRPSRTKGEFELAAALEFSFPFQNRRARGEVRLQRAKIQQLEDKVRFLRDKIEAEVRDASSALRAAFEGVAQARRGAELARRVLDAERRRFQLGDSNILVLNLREEAAAEATLQEVDALQSYWSATAAYQAALGAAAE